MINKSHPTRHRLVYKGEQGTVVEGKPFVSRWGSVLSALGLSLSGTILFANEVLLTEGDSDPVYIQACFQRMIAEQKLNVEINGFSALSTSNGKNADVMLRMLTETRPTPKLMVLFDGDEGGKEREKELKPLISDLKVASFRLDEKLAIEDYLPGGDDLYATAVRRYSAKIAKNEGQMPGVVQKATESLKAWRANGNEKEPVCSWCEEFAKEVGLKAVPSKVGIAREYIGLMEDVPLGGLDESAVKVCLGMLQSIIDGLLIPEQAPTPQKILKSTDES